MAAAVAVALALVLGTPTDIVPTPFYRRMTPVVWWDYPIWAVSALLGGLIAATYVRAGGNPVGGVRRASGGGALSFLAVGCPTCNKLVVSLLGAGGALSWFAPLQPLLGLAGVALLSATLVARLRAQSSCAPPRPYRSAATALDAGRPPGA